MSGDGSNIVIGRCFASYCIGRMLAGVFGTILSAAATAQEGRPNRGLRQNPRRWCGFRPRQCLENRHFRWPRPPSSVGISRKVQSGWIACKPPCTDPWVPPRFRVQMQLPQVSDRYSAFVGRVDPDEFVTEQRDDFDTRPLHLCHERTLPGLGRPWPRVPFHPQSVRRLGPIRTAAERARRLRPTHQPSVGVARCSANLSTRSSTPR